MGDDRRTTFDVDRVAEQPNPLPSEHY